jgi:uncharacterized protein YcfJ
MAMKFKLVCCVLSATMVAGCAAPNTPGAGGGANYTPVIDLEGVIPERYSHDLAACRQYARTINPAGNAIAGAIIGGLIGAAIGSSVSRGSRWQGSTTRFGAGYGATSGALSAGGQGVATQQRIMTNCMAGRGYRTLDGSTPAAYSGPSPYASSSPYIGQPPAPAAPAVYNPAEYRPRANVTGTLPQRETGRETYQAEAVAKSLSCGALPTATLTYKAPGLETYSIPCESGDVMVVQCEMGSCRELK